MHTTSPQITFSPNGTGVITLTLARQPVPLSLTWLPEEEILSCDAGVDTLDITTRSGLRLQMRCEMSDGVPVWRGMATGIPQHQRPVLPADNALIRQYAAGGFPLFRATAPLAASDAHLRPRWQGEGWTAEFLTLDPRTGAQRIADTAVIEMRLYPPYCGGQAIPFAFALLAAPTEQFTAAWRSLAVREQLPGAHLPDVREKVLRIAQRPTLFTTACDSRTGPRLLEWAEHSGFGSIMLHCPIWTASNATYQPNTRNWPGGWPALRAFVEQARARGLAIGLHTMTTSIANHDPYIAPVPDSRLLTLWRTTLTREIGADDTVLPLADSPAGLSTHEDYMSFGMALRIGNEIIRYGDIDAEGHTVRACRRGAYGTRPAAHAKGDLVEYLFRLFDEFAVDTESSLADEVAANIARAFQETGAEMVYFDDSEAVPDPYLAHISRFHEKIWRAIDLPHLHVQASSTGHYGAYLLSRVGQNDTVIDKRALLDYSVMPNIGKYLAADLVPDFGWFGLVFGDLDRDATSNDDLDCLLARMTGSGGGVTIFGDLPATGTPLFRKLGRRISAWQRAAPHLPPEHRASLATPGREFRPRPEGGEVLIRESRPWRSRLTADDRGEIALAIDNPGADQPLAITLTARTPLAGEGDPGNLALYRPGQAEIVPVSGAALPVVSADGVACLRWQVQDAAQDFARWRVTFPQPLDVSRHRPLALRYRLTGVCEAAVARVVVDLASWIRGREFSLPVLPEVDHAVIDPLPDPSLHYRGRWPDDWYSYAIGVDFTRIEAAELVLIGLHDAGELALQEILAQQELRPPGPWNVTLQADSRDYLGVEIPWDGTLELQPAADGAQAAITEASGALRWEWQYAGEDVPRLRHGTNNFLLRGFAPGTRVDVRIDRVV